MSTPITEPATDVVVCGLGHTGGPIAAELTKAGYNVVGIEKGPFWDYSSDWQQDNKDDEWAISVERKFDHPLYISTFTIRNTSDQFAMPVRRYTKLVQYHALGHAVGGAGTHYGGSLGRFSPWSYSPVSMTIAKYGQDGYNTILSNVKGGTPDLEDWPVTYDEMVPYYKSWEQAIGVVGTNQEPFIPDSTFRMPPHPTTAYAPAFKSACESLGYTPYSSVSGLISGSYTNQYGISRNGCVYCGWCGGLCNYPCEVGAKSSSHVTTIPAAMNTGKFTMVLESYVFRIDTDGTGKATGVRYYDPNGVVHIQPAKVVFNGIWGHNIIRSMLLSGIGTPYNPVSHTGSLGRGLQFGYYPSTSSASIKMDVGANGYCSGNASGGGYAIMDLNEVNPKYSHTDDLTFMGGVNLSFGNYIGSGPNTFTTLTPGASNFGSTWKAGIKDEKIPKQVTASLSGTGPTLPVLEHYSDLDPHYNDIYGDPCSRITLDWDANPYRVSNYLINKTTLITDILKKMGDPSTLKTNTVAELTQHVDWWGHHTRGGARTGSNPATSVFNKWMQCWNCENLFAASEICDTFGDNITAGTHVAGAMAYLAADGIKKYLQNPGPLV
jgi:gluconate 2-dehydrogenase alpha chain